MASRRPGAARPHVGPRDDRETAVGTVGVPDRYRDRAADAPAERASRRQRVTDVTHRNPHYTVSDSPPAKPAGGRPPSRRAPAQHHPSTTAGRARALSPPPPARSARSQPTSCPAHQTRPPPTPVRHQPPRRHRPPAACGTVCGGRWRGLRRPRRETAGPYAHMNRLRIRRSRPRLGCLFWAAATPRVIQHAVLGGLIINGWGNWSRRRAEFLASSRSSHLKHSRRHPSG